MQNQGRKCSMSIMDWWTGVGQEYNIRKRRKGAFWQDRYHATAVETGEHLRECLVYIDLNMVRAGILDRPSQWYWCGYNEIQKPRRKNVLIDYDKLRELAGYNTFDTFQTAHRKWVDSSLASHGIRREQRWSERKLGSSLLLTLEWILNESRADLTPIFYWRIKTWRKS